MSIDGAIKLGEQVAKDLAEKKEADRLAALTPEQKKENEAKAQMEAKAAEEAKLLEAKDEELDEAGKARKEQILADKAKNQEAEEARILSAKEEELSEEEIATREILLAEKTEAEKEAKIQAKIDARINEVTGKLKALENQTVKKDDEIKALRQEIEILKNGTNNTEQEIESKEAERITKYLKEDAKLPREKRREMSDSELEEWMVEDLVSAQRWLSKQELRRDKERLADLEAMKPSKNDESKIKADEVIRKQQESKARVALKHPELDVTKRIAELKGQGKTEQQIQETIFKENPKARVVAEILREDAEKYVLSENGPELLAEEMERRLKNQPKNSVKTKTQEEIDQEIEERVQAELKRRESLPENLRSNREPGQERGLSELEKAQFAIYQRSFPGKTIADFKAMLKRREKVAG